MPELSVIGEDAVSSVMATVVASSVISNSACASDCYAFAMATGALTDLIASPLGGANILNQ